MNKRHYEHTLPNIRGSLSNTYVKTTLTSTTGVGIQGYSRFFIPSNRQRFFKYPSADIPDSSLQR